MKAFQRLHNEKKTINGSKCHQDALLTSTGVSYGGEIYLQW
jgi:hypothetical protein